MSIVCYRNVNKIEIKGHTHTIIIRHMCITHAQKCYQRHYLWTFCHNFRYNNFKQKRTLLNVFTYINVKPHTSPYWVFIYIRCGNNPNLFSYSSFTIQPTLTNKATLLILAFNWACMKFTRFVFISYLRYSSRWCL